MIDPVIPLQQLLNLPQTAIDEIHHYFETCPGGNLMGPDAKYFVKEEYFWIAAHAFISRHYMAVIWQDDMKRWVLLDNLGKVHKFGSDLPAYIAATKKAIQMCIDIERNKRTKFKV